MPFLTLSFLPLSKQAEDEEMWESESNPAANFETGRAKEEHGKKGRERDEE